MVRASADQAKEGVSPNAGAPSEGDLALSGEILVNRRRFGLVAAQMSGADIAAMIGVPADNAVVERETLAGGLEEVPLDRAFEVRAGQSFLVTRAYVMGGALPAENKTAQASPAHGNQRKA